MIFPKFNFFGLSFIFLVPFLWYLLKNPSKSKREVFLKSWLAGTGGNVIMFYWIFYPLKLSGAGLVGSAAGVLFLGLYLGLYWGLFGLFVRYAKKNRVPAIVFLIPATWVLLEFIKAHFLTGFPWLLTGYSLWRIPHLIQIADITGVYGLSYFVVFINTVLAFAILNKTLKPFLKAVPVFILVMLYPYSVDIETENKEPYRVSILQGNISQYEKWDSVYKQNILNTYRKLHQKAVEYEPHFIVWPETSLPGVLVRNPDLVDYVKNLSKKSGAVEIIGSVEQDRTNTYNSVYFVYRGDISLPYRKVHLTPFGEYIPLRPFFSLFIDIVNQIGDFKPGDHIVPRKARDFYVGTAICFESIFPYISREFFNQGAQLYVNITNDGWFLDSAGPEQHFIHSVFRAVENRRYAVRAANTGVSGIITPSGEVEKRTPLRETGVLNGIVYRSDSQTFYMKYGDVFAYFCIIAWGVVMILKGYKINVKQESV